MSLSFYKPTVNPTGLTGTVGGQITTGRFYGVINELFCHVPAPPSGTTNTFYQYRKVYVKNEYITSVTNAAAWIEAAEHPEQIHLALETSPHQSITGATTCPSGLSGYSGSTGQWYSATGYANAVPIGTLAASSSTGIWLRQTLSGINQSDPYVALTLHVGGIVS